jgi:hypothetical protein
VYVSPILPYPHPSISFEILDGVRANAGLGTGRAMGEDEQNIDCLSSVMCCSLSGNVDGQKVQFLFLLDLRELFDDTQRRRC